MVSQVLTPLIAAPFLLLSPFMHTLPTTAHDMTIQQVTL